MYGNNPYIQNYSQQSLNDKIDNEIARLQQMKNHNITQPAINQTFQLAPQNNGIKFVNGKKKKKKEFTIADKEIKPKDEKDLIIEDLQKQINEMKGKIRNEQQYRETSNEYESKQFNEPIKDEKSSNVSNVKPSKPKSR